MFESPRHLCRPLGDNKDAAGYIVGDEGLVEIHRNDFDEPFIPPTSTSSVQFSNLSTLMTPDTARFILYKLDADFGSDDGKWLVISWIPDGVKVR